MMFKLRNACKNKFNWVETKNVLNKVLEPYKIFTIEGLKSGVNANLKGSFSWGGYIKNTKPDSKFGHTKFEYLTQIPLISLVFTGMIYSILIVVTYPSILFQQVKENLNAK